MAFDLRGVRIAVLGGDRREVELVRALAQAGAQLVLAGLPQPAGMKLPRVDHVPAAVQDADCVIAPMSGTDPDGVVAAPLCPDVRIRLDEAALQAMRPGTPLLVGTARPVVSEAAARAGVRVVELAELDEIAILNSIPTAEGAIALAMERLPITLHGSRAVVVGFGRCGITLARMLLGIGARAGVVARSAAQRARAVEMGTAAHPVESLSDLARDADVIFNTVPALVLTREILAAMRKDALVIDLASHPGGTDFAAATDLGRTAILALGLPGKVAPLTAGRILAQTVPRLIREAVRSRGGGLPGTPAPAAGFGTKGRDVERAAGR